MVSHPPYSTLWQSCEHFGNVNTAVPCYLQSITRMVLLGCGCAVDGVSVDPFSLKTCSLVSTEMWMSEKVLLVMVFGWDG